MATLLSSSRGSSDKDGTTSMSTAAGDTNLKRDVSNNETSTSDNQDIIGLTDIYTIVFVISTFPVELAQVCNLW